MDRLDAELAAETSRRRFLQNAALGGAAIAAAPALAQGITQGLTDLHLPGGNAQRPMTSAFPGKGSMILQRVHPPLLETPMDVFDRDVFTPNDQFFVRWHWADIPTSIDVDAFRLTIRGHVNKPIAISLEQLMRLPRLPADEPARLVRGAGETGEAEVYCVVPSWKTRPMLPAVVEIFMLPSRTVKSPSEPSAVLALSA